MERDQFVEVMEQMWGSTPRPTTPVVDHAQDVRVVKRVRFTGYIAKGQWHLDPSLLDPCLGAGWWLAGCPEMAPISQTDGSFDQNPAAA
jgi:hypothetical protein